jgi:hypothetical protein
MLCEVLLQSARRLHLDEDRLLFSCDVEIHERQTNFAQLSRATQKPPIDAQLCPVQGAMIRGDATDVAAVSLKLLQLARVRIIAICAAANDERSVVSREIHFRFIMGAAPSAYDAVTRDAFICGRRWREAHVQVALLSGELTERPNGHVVFELRMRVIIRRSDCSDMRHNVELRACRVGARKNKTALRAPSIQAASALTTVYARKARADQATGARVRGPP